ncbi:hypothetical protein [Desulfurivibrio alkaliphilus]|uniref:Uncharacterized protein n=1 Tax=Desulfurivibrio alkaliphilus (strain DSM 19089 / UNIQEM U267 / AHT2) TaxID=589865 RepID=D6Z2D3_DESAT|nr:hypothetical protein [Desulfurivibrio alkaliphilus]ADH85708.1 hypothetical protein DaAHT2_1007 [Desulfurivibrio alkaliphilus AHT 2]
MALKRNKVSKGRIPAAETEDAEITLKLAPVPKEKTKAEQVIAAHPAIQPAKTQRLLFDDKKNQYVAEFGTLPHLQASNGNVMDNNGKLLGYYVDIQIVSLNDIYIVGPCDNKAPADLVRRSYDNKFFADRPSFPSFPNIPVETVGEYIQELKAAWPNAASKRYQEVIAVLHGSAKPTELIGQLVLLELSPSSVKKFEKFRLQMTLQLASGLVTEDQLEVLRIWAESNSSRLLACLR